jgi:uncharacterized SAM-binding protein YcdF (DUF218 family)
MRKKLLASILFLIMLIAVCAAFKTPILQPFSNFLMKQDAPEKADLMVVLSGSAFDRGNEGARLYKEGYAKQVICPGGNLEDLFLILGDTMYESDLCRKNVIRNGVADSLVTALHYGTSTREEADTILGYCKQHQIKKIIVVTTLFHTRRAGRVYKERFAKEGITVLMRGAHASDYSEDLWWQSEYGLIALNNEYMKTLYYLIKRDHHRKTGA